MPGRIIERRAPRAASLPLGTKIRRLTLVNVFLFAASIGIGEGLTRLLWNPKYWIRCDGWLVGSGQTKAGRKWWPNTTYRIESQEFHVAFHTNERGYRARPAPPKTAHPFRIALVGDSFTEAMQVDYDRTFCALIERGLSDMEPGREIICENFGVAATGLFDYYHRIIHDVLDAHPPDALILCLYPGNDFTPEFPDDAFLPDGRPRHDYFQDAGCTKHVMMWLNSKSKLAHYLFQSAFVAWLRLAPPPVQGPKLWWTDPAVAARAPEAPAIRRARALVRAIDEECRRRGTKLCILVVGPVEIYFPTQDGQSPIARMLADWKIGAPVIDVAIKGIARPDFRALLFPRDGHLNEAGHAFTAAEALPALRDALAPAIAARAPGEIPRR
jgi:hypothetical protein